MEKQITWLTGRTVCLIWLPGHRVNGFHSPVVISLSLEWRKLETKLRNNDEKCDQIVHSSCTRVIRWHYTTAGELNKLLLLYPDFDILITSKMTTGDEFEYLILSRNRRSLRRNAFAVLVTTINMIRYDGKRQLERFRTNIIKKPTT